jgi:hypothetical protein
MVTNYPHAMTAHQALRATATPARAGGIRRVLELLHQMFCGLGGHDALLHFEDERIALRCVSCGHETPGWELNEVPPTVTVTGRGEVRRPALARPQLVSARRIA